MKLPQTQSALGRAVRSSAIVRLCDLLIARGLASSNQFWCDEKLNVRCRPGISHTVAFSMWYPCDVVRAFRLRKQIVEKLSLGLFHESSELYGSAGSKCGFDFGINLVECGQKPFPKWFWFKLCNFHLGSGKTILGQLALILFLLLCPFCPVSGADGVERVSTMLMQSSQDSESGHYPSDKAYDQNVIVCPRCGLKELSHDDSWWVLITGIGSGVCIGIWIAGLTIRSAIRVGVWCVRIWSELDTPTLIRCTAWLALRFVILENKC